MLATGPVVPPDPLQVHDLDQDQRHDREEEELPAHRPTVSGGRGKRTRPIGLNGPAEKHRPPARGELRDGSHQRHQKEREKAEAKNEFAAHCLTGRTACAVSSRGCGLSPLEEGKSQATERREARMYVGLGTILLIVLIIILLIWIF